nr:hypothetical protein [Gemmatimonadota bacterium]NIX22974.1 hypothetical protein [Actinomycetota bacterium]
MTTPAGPPQRRPGQSSPPERPAGESASRERGARRRDGTAFQSLSWFMARLLGVYYDIRVHRPPDLLDSPAGTRLILMPTHQ